MSMGMHNYDGSIPEWPEVESKEPKMLDSPNYRQESFIINDSPPFTVTALSKSKGLELWMPSEPQTFFGLGRNRVTRRFRRPLRSSLEKLFIKVKYLIRKYTR